MKRKKNKNFRLVLLFLFALSGVVFYLIASGKISIDSGSKKISIKEEEEVVNYKNCYAVLSNYEKYQKSITLRELKSASIYTSSEQKEFFKAQGFKNVAAYADATDGRLYPFLKENGNYLIVLPEDVDYRLKNLYVDGKFLWDKNDVAKYPLCFEMSEKLAKGDVQKFKDENLYEHDGEYYNFDISSIGTIFAGGEIIPARAVDRTWLNQSNNYTLLFDRLSKVISESDIAIAMLENPISGDPTPCKGCMMFVGDERNAQGFKQVGFDAFGIGNHFGDGGQNAIDRTIKALTENEIGLAGASTTTLEDTTKPVILEFKGRKVALLSAEDVSAYYWFGQDWGTNYYSTKSSSGGVGGVDAVKIQSDIAKAKEQADIVIVMMSWGTEYTNGANSHQKELAHAIIDAGADMIVGSHPHWVQSIEIYKEKPILYSLGNFIFDQTGEGPGQDYSRRNGETRQGMTVQFFYYKDKMVSMDFIPHKMCGYDQVGGESYNKTRNLAWKVQAGEMTYAEVDQTPENQGCVWYQPTPVAENSSSYSAIWKRVIEFSNI